MGNLLYEANLGDRTFYLHGGSLWERRWTGSTWQWLKHSHAPTAAPAKIGVMLGDTSKDLGLLYVQNQYGSYPYHPQQTKSVWTKWAIYRFRLSASDPTDPADIEHDDYPLVEHVNLPTVSALRSSPSWKLYAQIAVDDYQAAPTSGSIPAGNINGVGVARFNSDLEVETWRGAMPTFTSLDYHPGRVGVMSDHDVFLLPDVEKGGDSLLHVDVPFDLADHRGKHLVEISDGKDPDVARLFGFQNDHDLLERVYDNGWDWRKHGRPVAKQDFVRVVPGSMRSDHRRVFFIAETTWGGNRIYERWTDGVGGWWWGEHGHPNSEVVTEIGHPMKDSFFVATSSGRLWQRHYRHADNAWAWENHGIPQ